MQNIKATQQQQLDEIKLQDAYNDDYWQKKYGVSTEELKATGNIGIPAKIVSANNRSNRLIAEC